MSASPGAWAIAWVIVARVLWAVLGHPGSPGLASGAGVTGHPAVASRHAVVSPAGHARPGGYPYASATCEYGASGGPHCASPGDPGDLYNWGYRQGPAFAGSDPWGYEYRNCTSYVAWRLYHAGVRATLFSDLGNASQWLASVAGEPGVVVSRVPSPGAVAVWVVSSGVGHVAWVDSVRSAVVTVSDYNYAGTGAFDTHVVTTPPAGYIRFPR